MTAYYNENNPDAAEHLRNLINENLIAPGIVDERSIVDVRPNDLKGYSQCHFFAGIGGWSLALRQAGWPDDRPVWTGSCPCQPFSTAGKAKGFADERHLWPDWQWLIRECRPNVVFGEQVAGKGGEAWIDVVSTDLEGEGYTFGAAVTAACGFGGPHQRKRLYWVADDTANGRGKERTQRRRVDEGNGEKGRAAGCDSSCSPRRVADDDGKQSALGVSGCGRTGSAARKHGVKDTGCTASLGMANCHGESSERDTGGFSRKEAESDRERGEDGCQLDGHKSCSTTGDPGALNGFWRDADWLFCRDEKWRPVEPGTFPLADGIRSAVGRMRPLLESLGYSPKEIRGILRKPRSLAALASKHRVAGLRGYGNAIVAGQARAFIETYNECRADGIS